MAEIGQIEHASSPGTFAYYLLEDKVSEHYYFSW